jgi:hypothetical protein
MVPFEGVAKPLFAPNSEPLMWGESFINIMHHQMCNDPKIHLFKDFY